GPRPPTSIASCSRAIRATTRRIAGGGGWSPPRARTTASATPASPSGAPSRRRPPRRRPPRSRPRPPRRRQLRARPSISRAPYRRRAGRSPSHAGGVDQVGDAHLGRAADAVVVAAGEPARGGGAGTGGRVQTIDHRLARHLARHHVLDAGAA